ncbi:cytochrome c oxidase assembly protein [Oceanobacillus profundus]|uniref:cytochrome c oxidase assembly protein n=1 Tax=Oceanobacillus TaxID=182709 RepID=UPI0026E37B3B|nr:cytochrome c oxidase assembly protein [Oceanobacillus profundus]MDO6450320.1 cytochrome c oxidase assembly protein [Oceanobacillus profundus]
MLDIILDEFHFSTLWNGGIFLFTMFAAIIYFFLLPTSKKHRWWKSLAFVVGLIVIFIASASPLNVTGRIKFSTHSLQLVLLLLIAPPLLIAGFKTEILKRMKSIGGIKKVIVMLTQPIVATVLFQVVFYSYHIPFIFNFARLDLYLNYFFLLALFLSAVLLWIPLLSSNQLSRGQKWKYSFVNIVLLAPFSMILFFAKTGLYAIYSDINLFMSALALCLPDLTDVPPEFFTSLLPFDPVHEQWLGALYFFGGILISFTIVTFLSTKRI